MTALRSPSPAKKKISPDYFKTSVRTVENANAQLLNAGVDRGGRGGGGGKNNPRVVDGDARMHVSAHQRMHAHMT
jgi:hypothetical protein